MGKTGSVSYLKIARHYQDCIRRHGDSARGMDWPSEKDNQVRFRVMAELFGSDFKKIKVLDFGCGSSRFFDYLKQRELAKKIQYIGLDILPEAIEISKKKYPTNRYICGDALQDPSVLPRVDYAIFNGVFTQKRSLSQREMQDFLLRTLSKVFSKVRIGLAFNVMSDQADFKRRGSFHLSTDWLAKTMARRYSRYFTIRHDYGLYENTIYLFKKGLDS